MSVIRKNISISHLAAARLTAEARRKGASESAVIAGLVMNHLPATRLDVEADAEFEAGLESMKMPSGWGEPPAWKAGGAQ